MKRRLFAIVSAAICLFLLLSFSVLAEVSIPEGFDVKVPLSSWDFVHNDIGFVTSFFGDSILDIHVDYGSSSLGQLLNSTFESFPLLGYFSPTEYGTLSAQMHFEFQSGYDDLYIVVPRYQIFSRSDSTNIFSFSAPNSTWPSVSLGSVPVSWDEVYSGGPSVSLYFYVWHISEPSFDYYSTIRYISDYFGSYAGRVYFPLFSPIAFTTQESADSFVRDQLGSINDAIQGTNSRLDEIDEGLFSSPPGWNDYNQSMQDKYEDQASLEASLDEEANSIIVGGFEGLSYDPDAAASAFNSALGGDDYWAGSDMTSLFRWLWEVNPMMVVEVTIVGGFFVVFLIVRTYA